MHARGEWRNVGHARLRATAFVALTACAAFMAAAERVQGASAPTPEHGHVALGQRLGGTDCNDNDVDDLVDILGGTSLDCNSNAVPDECDLTEPSTFDCNDNVQVDSCEVAAGSAPDCNGNNQPDACDLIENDCNNDGVPNQCDPDCNGNELSDACDILFGFDPDCDLNRVPDECDLSAGTSSDGDENGVPDTCVFWVGTTGFWSNAAQWDPMVVPDNDPPDVYNVTIASFLANVTLDIDAEIQTLRMDEPNFARGAAPPELHITQGDLTIESTDGMEINGLITIGPGHGLIGGTTFGIRGVSPLRLAGGDAFIRSRSSGNVITSRTGVRGFGRISADFVNESEVIADVGETQLAIAGPGTKVNNGDFRAASGATLLLEVTESNPSLGIGGTGNYLALGGGTMQFGDGGGSVAVSGRAAEIYDAAQFTMHSPWSLTLSEVLFVFGGVFDPDAETSGFLEVPLARVWAGVMNIGADTTANIGEIDVELIIPGRADGASAGARGLTPPVLNIRGNSRTTTNHAQVGESGQVVVDDTAEVSVSDDVSLGLDDVRAVGLTPPVLNVKGGGKLSAGSLGVMDGGMFEVAELGTAQIEGTASVGNDAARGGVRGLTPPVLNVANSGRVSAGAIHMVGASAVNVTDSGQADASGDFDIGDGATRGLTPPVLNVTGGAKASSGGNFSIETSAMITVTGSVSVGGNFNNLSTEPATFDWEEGTLSMDGGAARGVQMIEIAGENRGPLDLSGFNQNFAFGVLNIGTNAVVHIVDLFDNQQDGNADCDESAYVDMLIIQPGGTLLADDCKLYFKTLINNGGTVPELGTRVIPIGGGDIDSNGVIDEVDFAAFLAAFGSCAGDPEFIAAADLDFDGCVTLVDYQAWYALYQQYGQVRSAGRAGPVADVSLRIEPAATTVGFGDVFTVDIVADIANPVLGWGLDFNIVDPGKLLLVGPPTVGASWMAASAADGDDLAALAFPTSQSGSGIVLATMQLVAVELGQTDLTLSVTAGDLAEGVALDPAGFATLAFESATVMVVPGPPSTSIWNWVDVGIPLTANQPTYWSVATGEPGPDGAGVSPFTILDPGPPPGRPVDDGSGQRRLRGFILAWAVDPAGQEIRWNHLAGDAVVVNYDRGTAWEYNAFAFQVVSGTPHGMPTASPGQLFLNGSEFANGYDLLLLDVYATGSQPFALNSGFAMDTELTLMPLDIDVRQETSGPVTTKASFTVWNQNEVKLTGMDRCITCWDDELLSRYAPPNEFLIANMHTDKGKAQIDGLASALCNFDFDPGDGLPIGGDPRDVVSQGTSLLGLAVKQIAFSATGPYDAAGMNLVGMGVESGRIQTDLLGAPPPERPSGLAGGAAGVRRPSALPAAGAEQSLALAAGDRTSASEKGSLLIFPKVELRWDATGTTLLQDTFIDLTNDYPASVLVQMYFVNGDASPLP